MLPVWAASTPKARNTTGGYSAGRPPREWLTWLMTRDTKTVALVGGGVIGSGWATRCLSRGLDVVVTDPADGAEAAIRDAVQRVWPTMVDAGCADGASPDRLTFAPDIATAVTGADFVQENVPEREDIKRSVIAEISRHVPGGPDGVIIASSSSGLLPTAIQADAEDPGRVLVGHPFSPLYILPLVEVVGGEQTTEAAILSAAAFYESIGMRPLHVRNEIEAYLSDRLMEALWREALHLVDDGIATIPEIDAAITGGPGLRWAFMGIAMGWHVAAAEGGMRQSMKHFAPTLELPWTKLEAPTYTDRLEELIVSGCEAEQGDRHWQELERRRDITLLKIQEVIDEHWYPAGEDGWPPIDLDSSTAERS
jgi:carnitine 3-dehydrogenase